MNDSTNIKELISRYVDQQVTSEEEIIAKKAINESAALKAYYRELCNLNKVLDELPKEKPSPDWENRIQSSLLEVTSKEGHKMNKKSSLFKVSVGGGAVFALVLCVFIGHLYTEAMLQERVRDASKYFQTKTQSRYKTAADDIGDQYDPNNYMTSWSDELGTTVQYEPYYLQSSYDTGSSKTQRLRYMGDATTQTRLQAGFQSFQYDSSLGLTDSQVSRLQGKGFAGAGLSQRTLLSQEMTASQYQDPRLAYVPEYPHYEGEQYNPYYQTEEYTGIYENEFMAVSHNPLSTFSIDVDNGL